MATRKKTDIDIQGAVIAAVAGVAANEGSRALEKMAQKNGNETLMKSASAAPLLVGAVGMLLAKGNTMILDASKAMIAVGAVQAYATMKAGKGGGDKSSNGFSRVNPVNGAPEERFKQKLAKAVQEMQESGDLLSKAEAYEYDDHMTDGD